jgi:hypothetical protein
LVPVELPDVGFEVERVFVVTAPAGGSHRGDHRVACREVIVLVGGEVEVEIAVDRAGPFTRHALHQPGQYVAAGPGDWLRYTMRDDRSVLLVLADAPYDAAAEAAQGA